MMIPTKDLYNRAWGFSRKIMEGTTEQLHPLVYLHVKGDHILAMPFKPRKDDPSAVEDFMKDVIIHMVRVGLHAGLVEGVVMPGEAWMAHVDMEKDKDGKPIKPDLKNLPRASKSPNRIECLVLAVWGAEGRKIGFYEIKNRRIGKEIELIPGHSAQDLQAKFECWLDEGFDMLAVPSPKDKACAILLQTMMTMIEEHGKTSCDMSKFFFGAIENFMRDIRNQDGMN